MSDKGKGKATNPISFDSDSDDDFFVSRRRPIIRETTAPRSPTPPIRTHSDSEDDDDASPGSQRKKKPRKAPLKKPTLDLPAWTRHGSNGDQKNGSRSRKSSSQIRGSKEERADMIVIDDSDEEIGIVGGSSSKHMKKVTRKRVQLTPPPEMSEKSKADIVKLVREHMSEKYGDQAPLEDSASSPEKDRNDVEKVHVTIRMQAPPEKKQTAAPAAIKEYQKARTLILSRTGPMSTGISILSERIQKRPEDVILVYDDKRVYPRSTPAQLGILDKAEMIGYEKDYWMKLEADKIRALEEDLSFSNNNDDDEEGEDDVIPLNPNGNSPSIFSKPSYTSQLQTRTQSQSQSQSLPQTQTQTQTQTQAQQDIIHFKISSSFGEERMKGPKTLKLHSVIRFYLKKLGRPVDEADKWYIMFDGEKLDRSLRIEETEVEDGDMLEAGM
ncbi:hypothetical protein I203_104269 [Kwoniella mangroviensis CBS 8507]|uniref:uncharacterized protein n=1 Tax=Kwoniella mangroviensis CBS 8507 TaxID=1296122 RepID=UPI003060AC5B